MNIYCVVAGDHPTAFVKDSGMLPYYLHLLTDYDVFFVSHVPPLSEQNNERKESYERVQGMKCIYVPCKNKKLFHDLPLHPLPKPSTRPLFVGMLVQRYEQ